jgi:hypothetical protein
MQDAAETKDAPNGAPSLSDPSQAALGNLDCVNAGKDSASPANGAPGCNCTDD